MTTEFGIVVVEVVVVDLRFLLLRFLLLGAVDGCVPPLLPLTWNLLVDNSPFLEIEMQEDDPRRGLVLKLGSNRKLRVFFKAARVEMPPLHNKHEDSI